MAGKERSLEETPTWVVAVVCFVLLAISIAIQPAFHLLGAWLEKKHKRDLFESLQKIKAVVVDGELMLLGFISLLLTIVKDPISKICVSKRVGNSWHPCQRDEEKLESAYENACTKKGQVQFVSAYGIQQLQIFISVLAVSHLLYCITTFALGRLKMRKWKAWEVETRTPDPRNAYMFRFARETSFGRRHLGFWSNSPVLLWIVCFCRQFYSSVTKVDYVTLRNGFIYAHLAPQSTNFDFQKYISRSLDDDFKYVVEISPMWFIAVLFLLTNTYGWYSYLWLPFIPLIIILLVGTKLQMIITIMGLRIHEKGDAIKGTMVVQPGDDLFWFNRPRLILYIINLVFFTNAFQLAFIFWSWYQFGSKSCYHRRLKDVIILISMGVIIQILCSYVTLPLYALVTQMGSSMKPAIFSDNVATALKRWHQNAKKHTKHGTHSESRTPFSSRPGTPIRPIHLLRHYRSEVDYSAQTSLRHSNYDNEGWDPESSPSPHKYGVLDDSGKSGHTDQQERVVQEPNAGQSASGARPGRAQHEIQMNSADFSFKP